MSLVVVKELWCLFEKERPQLRWGQKSNNRHFVSRFDYYSPYPSLATLMMQDLTNSRYLHAVRLMYEAESLP
jgi:hypothetical protein